MIRDGIDGIQPWLRSSALIRGWLVCNADESERFGNSELAVSTMHALELRGRKGDTIE